MIPYVLDTDILTLFQENHPAVVRQVLQRPRAELAVAILSVEEQLSGWYTRLRRARDVDELARVYERMTAAVESLASFQILPFTKPAILRFQQLHALKLGVAKMDLRIASVVLELGGTLVTRNARDFQRVPGLQFVDWSV
jgi:tRNA(fMet)-specific endonuclease VapC